MGLPTLQNSKVLADAVEALVGAFWAGAGEPAACALLRRLGLLQSDARSPPAAAPPPQEPPDWEADGGGGGGGGRVDVSGVEAVLG